MKSPSVVLPYWEAVQNLITAVRTAEVTTPAIEQALEALDNPALVQVRQQWGVRSLIALMSDLSEEHWCAGWLSGNEHYLWECIQHPESQYGMYPLDAETLADLQVYATLIGGWVRWEGAPHYEAVYISMAEWEPRHAAWLAACAVERAKIEVLKQTHPELFLPFGSLKGEAHDGTV